MMLCLRVANWVWKAKPTFAFPLCREYFSFYCKSKVLKKRSSLVFTVGFRSSLGMLYFLSIIATGFSSHPVVNISLPGSNQLVSWAFYVSPAVGDGYWGAATVLVYSLRAFIRHWVVWDTFSKAERPENMYPQKPTPSIRAAHKVFWSSSELELIFSTYSLGSSL